MHSDRPARRLSRRGLLRAGALSGVAVLGLQRAARALADEPPDGDDDLVTVVTPDNVATGQRWVDVNLSRQLAAAMEGDQIVRVILATTGMPGWDTPEGQFLIKYRVANERMTSDALGIPRDSAAGYDLDNVLWTQYFTWQGHALHDNYWRQASVFGHEATSHGCVGMVENDAHFLWSWVNVGSLVNIHY